MRSDKKEQRSVLLVGCDSGMLQRRAIALRRREIDVHIAGTMKEAGLLCLRNSYDLVLLATDEHSDEAAHLCVEVRQKRPKQRIALLVGAPTYLREIGGRQRASRAVRSRPKRDPGNYTPDLEVATNVYQPSQWELFRERVFSVCGGRAAAWWKSRRIA
jgi:response regulator RpfG family c-di-GMP phosphodiesterase